VRSRLSRGRDMLRVLMDEVSEARSEKKGIEMAKTRVRASRQGQAVA
jgi:hypothetical protein